MQQLSGLDAEFLYLETPKSPMHVGGVYVYGPPGKGEMNFKIFKEYLESRLHISRIFRQRLVESPLNLGHPYWIEDPYFDLNNHVFHTALPKPGGRLELKALAARIFARAMDRSKPLWEFTFVEGLENLEDVPAGSFALITKVHHAAIDGGSGAEILAALLEPSPVPKPNVPTKAWVPERIPTSIELLGKNFYQAFGTPLKFVKFAYETARNTYQVAKVAIDQAVQPPPLPFSAPKTHFNTTISPRRVFGGAEFSLEKIKAIKNALPNLTINDVVLTICAGALRFYLQAKKKLPEKSMVAMAPISTRDETKKSQMGNEVSAMLVSLATDVENAVERLKAIHENTRRSKVYAQAIGATELMDFIPSTLAALASRLYTRMKLSETHTPFYNLVITNVPGPPVPLYLNGCQLLTQFGTAPILDGLGLLLVILSYNGKVTVSATCTPELMPDVDRFTAYLHESFEELYGELVLAPAPESTPPAKPRRTKKAGTSKKEEISSENDTSYSSKGTSLPD
ncbi:MAG: wax ester/triacylglycerol synthase family O-acyltransferase [Microscillaceae bacterium]